MRRLLLVTAVLALVGSTGCESSPKAKKTASSPEAPSKAGLQLDQPALVQRAQLLRDRDFEETPSIEAVHGYQPPTAGCIDRCAAERELLVDVLFDGKAPTGVDQVAHYDHTKNTIFWDAAETDSQDVRTAVLAALVEAIDRQTLPELPKATSWGEHLATEAVERGPGVFVAALDRAKRQTDAIEAAELAKRPELLAKLAPDRFATDFATREGFALTAAMHRAGGWSAVELLRNEPPASSMHVVRPDRYLQGTDTGTWKWPAEATKARTDEEWTAGRSGRVGPAVFVEWLSGHIEPRIARSAYLGWESDAYRVWRKDGDWVWEYLSLWNTPHVAQQIVEALDGGLRRQSPDGQYTVLRKGNTVAVIGSNQVLEQQSLDLAAQLVGMRPTFAPHDDRGLTFVPTPMDQLQSRNTDGISRAEQWRDEATGITVDLTPLGEEWTVAGTVSDRTLPWFAKHADGTILEYTTSIDDMFAPPFDSKKRLEQVVGAFRETVRVDGEIDASRTDSPAANTIVLQLKGTIKDGDDSPVQMKVWTFQVDDYVVAVSLQAPPKAFADREKTAGKLVGSLEVPTHQQETEKNGVIEFRVE